MHKLLICLSALAICLNVLPIPASAGDRAHHFWRQHKSCYLQEYNRPYYWSFPYYGYCPYPYRVDPRAIFTFDFD